MKSLICTDDLATDVTGAEALIERHNEHRTEIDARTNTFQVREDAKKISGFLVVGPRGGGGVGTL